MRVKGLAELLGGCLQAGIRAGEVITSPPVPAHSGSCTVVGKTQRLSPGPGLAADSAKFLLFSCSLFPAAFRPNPSAMTTQHHLGGAPKCFSAAVLLKETLGANRTSCPGLLGQLSCSWTHLPQRSSSLDHVFSSAGSDANVPGPYLPSFGHCMPLNSTVLKAS